MSSNNYKLIDVMDKPTLFMNLLDEHKLEEINRDFVFKMKSLQYPHIVSILINNGVSYNDNKFELVEIAIRYKYYDTLNIIVNKYHNSINELFEWGFERKGRVLDYDVNRMSKFYLIDKYFDKELFIIFSQSDDFVKDFMYYKYKPILIPNRQKITNQFKITKKIKNF